MHTAKFNSSPNFPAIWYVVHVHGTLFECAAIVTALILQESSWYRSCLHKGLIANIVFFVIMILGIVLGEVLFPLEGLRGRNTSLNNDTRCIDDHFEGITN